jgi:hypothetical protein
LAGTAIASLLSAATNALAARAEDAGPFSGCAISAVAPTGVAALSSLALVLGAGLLSNPLPATGSAGSLGAGVAGVDEAGAELGSGAGAGTMTGAGAGIAIGGVTTGGCVTGVALAITM